MKAPPVATATRTALATAAMVGVLVYVLVDAVLQFLPPHYDPIREAESNLAVGPYGWIMNLNFLGRALTTLCALGAIRLVGPPSRLRTAGLILLALGGAASAALAFFATDVDVVAGSNTAQYTSAGAIHLFIAGGGFIAALLAVVLLTAWLRRTRALGALAVAGVFAAITVCGAVWLAVAATVAPATLGLAERICLVGILGWTFVVCARIRRLGGLHSA